jgi:ElaA protein
MHNWRMDLQWRWHAWRDLDPDTVHAFFRLRAEVFVVEQHCAYADIDGLDPQCEHLCGADAQGKVLAYLRLLPPGLKSPEPAIGRVVVAREARAHGAGRTAMREAIDRCGRRWPGQPIFIAAQEYLQRFYESLGFVAVSRSYLEDGIPHVDMRRTRPLDPSAPS